MTLRRRLLPTRVFLTDLIATEYKIPASKSIIMRVLLVFEKYDIIIMKL